MMEEETMQLEHLTSSELIEKFSNVANYTVLFCELDYWRLSL